MNFKSILRSEQKTIGKATLIIAIFTILSRILGLFRDHLLASHFGAGTELDIYFAAFKTPDLVYSIILAGGVLVSLLPIFSDYIKENKQKAWELINNIINIFLLVLIFFSVLFIIFTSQIVGLLLPGLDPAYLDTAINLTRLIFIGAFFFGLSSIFSTILNYFDRFLVYSIAPILYNLGIIFGIVFLSSSFGIYGAGMGVVVGAFFHFFIQFIASLNYGYRYKPVLDLKMQGVKDFFKLLFPRTIAATASQINLIVITAIASGIAAGAISIFNFSNNLRYLPVGIIGISFATAAFPHLSKSVTDNNKTEFLRKFQKTFLTVLYFSFPVGLLMLIQKDIIVKIVLEAGAFTASATKITAICLGVFSLSLFAQCLEPIILRGFFSLKDTKTPTVISLIFLVVNVLLSLFVVNLLSNNIALNDYFLNLLQLENAQEVVLLGLIFAFNLSLIIDFLLLFIFFKKKTKDLDVKMLLCEFGKIVLCSAVMAVFSVLLMDIIEELVSISGFFSYLFEFCAITISAFAFYFILSKFFKVKAVDLFKFHR